MKENKGKSGQARKGKNTYMYANQLAFLNSVIHHRSTDTSLDHRDSPSPNQESGLVSETSVAPGELSDGQVSKKRKGNAVEKKLLEAIDNYNIRQKGKSQLEKVGASEDDDKLFLLSMLPLVKSIPAHLKLAARIDIMHTINKFITMQPATPPLQTQPSPNSQYHNQPSISQPGIQQYSILQPVSSGVQHYFPQEPQPGPSGIQPGCSAGQYLGRKISIYTQEQPVLTGIQQESVESNVTSPDGSVSSQEELTLF